MANTAIPISLPASVTDAGVVIDFSAVGSMGRVSLINRGPDPVYFEFDGAPPSAAIQNGVISLQEVGNAFNAGSMFFTTIGLVTGLGLTAVVEIVAWQSSGGAGESSGFQ